MGMTNENMDFDSLIKLIKERRSVRRYMPDSQVPLGMIRNIIEAGQWAPSGANVQMWEFVIVKKREDLKKIARVFLDQEKRIKKLMPDIPHPNQDFHMDISTYIMVCTDDRFKVVYTGPKATANSIFLYSLGACIQNMLLAASSQGLATAWQTPNFDPIAHRELKDIVDLPGFISIAAVIPVGYMGGKPKEGSRRPLDSMIHEDRFDETGLRGVEAFNSGSKFSGIIMSLKLLVMILGHKLSPKARK